MSARTLRVAKALVAVNSQGGIPPIPVGMIRLTHFTGPSGSNAVVDQGQNFRYKGLLDSTTDSFSNQQQVQDLIDQGETGGFTRSGFGDHVLLIDVPHEHHRVYRNPTVGINELDNRYVAGYVDRTSKQFQANPNYAPNQVPAPIVKQQPAGGNRGVGQNPVPSQAPRGVPQAPSNEGGDEDVW